MKIGFPSPEFDDAVADICHGAATIEQSRAMNELLRGNAGARDEYILRLELHTRLASEPDLFVSAEHAAAESTSRDAGDLSLSALYGVRRSHGEFETRSARSKALDGIPAHPHSLSPWRREGGRQRTFALSVIALTACIGVIVGGWWMVQPSTRTDRQGETSRAVAMLNQVVDAQWEPRDDAPRLGAPLEPAVLRLKSGLAQIVFYSGVRVAIEGPAELELISTMEASQRRGRLTADVPQQARGFRVRTPQMKVTDLGTVFGLDVNEQQTELHVFKGNVEFEVDARAPAQNLKEGGGAVAEHSRPARMVPANRGAFASLFDLQARSSVADTVRYDQWRDASAQLNRDPSLLVRLDFDRADSSAWRLRNTSERRDLAVDATVVGGQWIQGRWPDKRALEFGSVSDRVRLAVPGDYESLTLAAWVRVQGLDRRVNSLFMSDAFEPGTLHWLILNDGAPVVTVVGPPGTRLQIVPGPPLLTLDTFGMWQHVGVVVDGRSGQVVHYLNGRVVSETPLKIKPPFRVGGAELGNWNSKGYKGDESLMIRNFSGAMDEFCLFGRALGAEEMLALYAQGKPQPAPLVHTRK